MLVSCKFKYGIMVIGSRSMSGTINKGDTTIFEQYANQEIYEGDIRIFNKNNIVTVHRVISVQKLQNTCRYYTKGDANQSPDNGYIENKDQKRHYIITSAIILIIALFALSIIFILIYANSEKIEYFDYTENSDIDCKVYLKENTFFENQYLSTDHKYIASLISNIQADFDYELTTLQTVAIEMSPSEISNNGNDAIFIKDNNANSSLIKFTTLFLLIDIAGIVLLVKYYQDTKTNENVFSDKLRIILKFTSLS